jgi:hypothetical protein
LEPTEKQRLPTDGTGIDDARKIDNEGDARGLKADEAVTANAGDARRLQLNAVSSLLLLRASFDPPVFYPSSARPV